MAYPRRIRVVMQDDSRYAFAIAAVYDTGVWAWTATLAYADPATGEAVSRTPPEVRAANPFACYGEAVRIAAELAAGWIEADEFEANPDNAIAPW